MRRTLIIFIPQIKITSYQKTRNKENDYFCNKTKPRQTNEKQHWHNYNIHISTIRMQQTIHVRQSIK